MAEVTSENDLIEALGMADLTDRVVDDNDVQQEGQEVEHDQSGTGYDIIPDPQADQADLSELRGVKKPETNDDDNNKHGNPSSGKKGRKQETMDDSEHELENLAEILPDVKQRRRLSSNEDNGKRLHTVVEPEHEEDTHDKTMQQQRKLSMQSVESLKVDNVSVGKSPSLKVLESGHLDGASGDTPGAVEGSGTAAAKENVEPHNPTGAGGNDDASSDNFMKGHGDGDSLDDYPESDLVIEDEGQEVGEPEKVPKEFMNMNMSSSAQSISTATQTHEVRMPMYLPTFKPATGCTNASDFIVRCFVARLRAGITVVKHGRSRWCKSRLRVLHIHPDGRSLSWKPAEGEPASSKRAPKLDLSTCLEVRHAWSPDPQNPMYTGTQILRQKCEAANAHKSFALIFKSRTVDITAVTADQCKVLMEGFSALCFRLQVANLAGRGGSKKGPGGAQARPMPEEDGVSTTASATLTNTSTPRAR